jgi:hypothetical protein
MYCCSCCGVALSPLVLWLQMGVLYQSRDERLEHLLNDNWQGKAKILGV